MKIVFAGDSITEGIPGASYYDMLSRKLPGHELINMGKGGDTVVSLLKRLKKADLPVGFDIAVIEVGVNDIFVRLSGIYAVLNMFVNRGWARNMNEFEAYYGELLDYISKRTKRMLVIPPLFIGEDIRNNWNREIEVMNKVIRRLVCGYEQAAFLDVRSVMADRLKNRQASGYIAGNVINAVKDTVLLNTPDKVDKKSRDRGLYFTLDGLHPNSICAGIIADAIYKETGNPDSSNVC